MFSSRSSLSISLKYTWLAISSNELRTNYKRRNQNRTNSKKTLTIGHIQPTQDLRRHHWFTAWDVNEKLKAKNEFQDVENSQGCQLNQQPGAACNLKLYYRVLKVARATKRLVPVAVITSTATIIDSRIRKDHVSTRGGKCHDYPRSYVAACNRSLAL